MFASNHRIQKFLLTITFLQVSILSSPCLAQNNQDPTDEEIERIIMEDSGLGLPRPGESPTSLGSYQLDVRKSAPLIRLLANRMKAPAAEFMRIQEAIAEGRLGKSGFDLGLEAGGGLFGCIGLNCFIGSHESPRGNRWIHLGFGGRTFRYTGPGDAAVWGVIAGVLGRSFQRSNSSVTTTWVSEQNGGAFGIGFTTDQFDTSDSRGSGFIAGAGIGWMGGESYVKNAAFRLPIFPIPGILVSSTKRALSRLQRLQALIVRDFHGLDLQNAERRMSMFELELKTLKESLETRWLTKPRFDDKSLPAMHPFSSLSSLYQFSRVADSQGWSIKALVASCLRQ